MKVMVYVQCVYIGFRVRPPGPAGTPHDVIQVRSVYFVSPPHTEFQCTLKELDAFRLGDDV